MLSITYLRDVKTCYFLNVISITKKNIQWCFNDSGESYSIFFPYNEAFVKSGR